MEAAIVIGAAILVTLLVAIAWHEIPGYRERAPRSRW
jgi:hypothetical protein